MKLYHYSPIGNSCLESGICSVSLMPEFLFHYETRAKSKEHGKIIAWLDSTFEGRSKSIACFTEPLRLNGKIIDNGDLFSFDIAKLEKDGLLEDIYCKTRSGNGGMGEVFEKVSVDEIDWRPFDFSMYKTEKELINAFFKHYFVVLKDGVIPPKYLTLENKE